MILKNALNKWNSFQVCSITRDKKVPHLSSGIGPKNYVTLKNLTAPVLFPDECDLKEHLIQHFKASTH